MVVIDLTVVSLELLHLFVVTKTHDSATNGCG